MQPQTVNINIYGIPHRVSFYMDPKWTRTKFNENQYDLMTALLSNHKKGALPPIDGGIPRWE